MASKLPWRRVLIGVLCALMLGLLAVSAGALATAAQPAPPIDSGPDDTDTDGDRIIPSEQIPFGVRTIYGEDNQRTPAGGEGVSVAVIDSGVDTEHPDLQDRVTLCRDFTGDRVRNRCADVNGHGTHVAGTVAADAGPDDRGIYGVAPAAEIFAFKACRDDGTCGADPLANAIRAATDAGADVIVLSLGGRSEPRIQSATEYATERGSIVIAASGNSGPDIGSMLYPAAHPNVIAVGAVGPRDGDRVAPDNYRVPDFSARGVDRPFDEQADARLEVAAPGTRVLSPVPGGDYGTKTGTSMATPHVAGLAAKILAASPGDLSVSELRAELHERAPRYDVTAGRHARSGYDPASGFGIATISEPTPAFSVSPETPVSDESFTLDGTASRSDSPITEYEWDTTGDGTFDRTGERIEIERPSGTHPVTLRVRNAEGATGTVTRDVFVNDRPQLTIEAPESAAPGENVTFSATVDNEFGTVEIRWSFPDGTTLTGDRVTRSFDAGEQAVAATAIDEFGAATTEIVTVSVRDPAAETESEAESGPGTMETEDQGPAFAPALLVAVVLWALLARRYAR